MPDLLRFAQTCIDAGADGITVHPRPDERHIRYADVPKLRALIKSVEYNIEGYPNDQFLELIKTVRPDQCTLVPDPPGVLTSSEGWDTINKLDFLKEVVSKIKSWGVRVSIFLDPKPELVAGAAECGTDRIEIYTGDYAKQYLENPELAVSAHIQTAKMASKYGLGVNAGHDLDLKNLQYYADKVPNLMEVSIGHALVSDALYFGIQNTVGLYQRKLS